jgi:hypothetical protein
MQIAVKTDLRAYTKGMNQIAARQLPFAMAQTLTAVAGHVGMAWQDEMRTKLDRPTPFTLGGVAVRPARKTDLTATIYMRDVAATYLQPFVDGGPHFLGAKKGLLKPVNVPLNAYGNLSRAKLATLKAKPGVFIGAVRLKDGQIVNGVWQRQGVGRGSGKRRAAVTPKPTGCALKLLIRFADARPVTQRLDFKGRAEAVVRAVIEPTFAKAFAAALASAR